MVTCSAGAMDKADGVAEKGRDNHRVIRRVCWSWRRQDVKKKKFQRTRGGLRKTKYIKRETKQKKKGREKEEKKDRKRTGGNLFLSLLLSRPGNKRFGGVVMENRGREKVGGLRGRGKDAYIYKRPDMKCLNSMMVWQ